MMHITPKNSRRIIDGNTPWARFRIDLDETASGMMAEPIFNARGDQIGVITYDIGWPTNVCPDCGTIVHAGRLCPECNEPSGCNACEEGGRK